MSILIKKDLETKCRIASVKDIDAILHLENVCFVYEGEKFNRRQILYLIKSPNAIVYVLENNHSVIGWVIGLIRKYKKTISGRLYGLAINPHHHGKKLGELLTGKILHEMKIKGANRILLEVRKDNPAAIHLYKKFGFKELGSLPNYYEIGVHGIRMALDLDSNDN
jgi:[ribosomal protein S18]-alanine N-acetyltransferase